MTDLIIPQPDLPQTSSAIVWTDTWSEIIHVELRPDGDEVHLSGGMIRRLQPGTLAQLVDMRSDRFLARKSGFVGMNARLSSSGTRTRIAEITYPE